MTDLLAHLRTARRAMVLRLVESVDPERMLPEPGLLRLLSDLQAAIAAVEAETSPRVEVRS
jgi:hypothetical protein